MATITANNGAAGNFQDGSSWVGGVAPTAADDAVLPVGCTSMTIGTGSVCRSFTATAFTGTLTHTAGVDFRIGDGTAGAGNVALAFGTFTYTLGSATTSLITFISTSATVQTVNFNGKTTGNVTFNATSGGSWQYTGGHVTGAAATVTLTKGTLDINGQTCSWGIFDTNNSNTRSLTLGAAAITLTGSTAKVWNIDTATNLTLSAASSTITLTGATTTFSAGNAGFGYGSIIISGSGICKAGGGASTSCVNFTRTGTAAKTDYLYISTGTNMTCSGTFTCNGNSSINRVLVQGETIGTARTITAATWSVTNTDFQDITGAGAGSRDFSAQTDVGDCGGNNSITFPASVSQTWSGTSGGNWSTNAWTTRVPLPQDDVSLGVAFSASQTVTADMPRLGRSIVWTGATGTPTWSMATSIACTQYGSLVLISGMSVSGTAGTAWYFAGRGSYTITSSGKTFPNGPQISAPTGTYTLNDAFNCDTKGFNLNNGTFDANDFNVTCLAFILTGTLTRGVVMGTGTWTLNRTASPPWDATTTTNLTFSGANSTIVIAAVAGTTREFRGGGLTYGTLTYTVAGSTGELDITGSNSFAQINFSDVTNARSLKFTAATTTTIRNANGFNVRGTSGKLMTIDTISGASTFTLTSPNQQSIDYANIIRSTVDASPKWYAGANSTDGTGNTNWIFTNSPESVNSFTLYSSQYCLNFIYGTPDTQYSLQEIANLYNGTPSTRLSFQEVLNNRAGLQPNARSEQEALFQNVKTVLGLSDPYTLYSVQYLLNLCKARGIGLSTIFG